MKKITLAEINQILPATIRYLSFEEKLSQMQIADKLNLSRPVVVRFLNGANNPGWDLSLITKVFGEKEFNIQVPTVIYKYMKDLDRLISQLEKNLHFNRLRKRIIEEVGKRGLYLEPDSQKVRSTQQYVSFNFYYKPSQSKRDLNRQVLFVRYSQTEELILEFHCPNSFFRKINQAYFEFEEGKRRDELQKKGRHEGDVEMWYPKVRVQSLNEEDINRLANYALKIFDFLHSHYQDNG